MRCTMNIQELVDALQRASVVLKPQAHDRERAACGRRRPRRLHDDVCAEGVRIRVLAVVAGRRDSGDPEGYRDFAERGRYGEC